MQAIRQIYESLPDMVNVPAELRRRKVEVIILPHQKMCSAVAEGILPVFEDE